MAIDQERLKAYPIPQTDVACEPADCIRYALAIGLGQDPTDRRQLRYVYEQGLRVFPTMPVVLGSPGFWLHAPDTGITWEQVVHAGQALQLHAPLPVGARVRGRSSVVDVIDKGPGKGALMITRRRLEEAGSGRLLATIEQTLLCRGDGGFSNGERPRPGPAARPLPERAPDLRVDLPTRPEQALHYRLCADLNPLHVDPDVARAAGFERPILHGLATYGVCTHAVLRALDYRQELVERVDARFVAPVYPGDTVATELWFDGSSIDFRGSVPARERTVLTGTIGLREAVHPGRY